MNRHTVEIDIVDLQNKNGHVDFPCDYRRLTLGRRCDMKDMMDEKGGCMGCGCYECPGHRHSLAEDERRCSMSAPSFSRVTRSQLPHPNLSQAILFHDLCLRFLHYYLN
jgi:hypothetical protein